MVLSMVCLECNWDGWQEVLAEEAYARSYACAQPERMDGIRVAPAMVAQPRLFYLPGRGWLGNEAVTLRQLEAPVPVQVSVQGPAVDIGGAAT